MLTIYAENPAGMITNGGMLCVMVPANWRCRFDTSVNITFGGNAAGKVGTASYADNGRTLTIPVMTNFTNGDILTIAGLKLLDLALCAAGSQWLALDFTGYGIRDIYDECTLTLTVPWPGGSYDGWACCVMADSGSLLPVPKGTVFMLR